MKVHEFVDFRQIKQVQKKYESPRICGLSGRENLNFLKNMPDSPNDKYTYFFPDEVPLSEEAGDLYDEKKEATKNDQAEKIIKKHIKNNVWLSVSEAANLGGIQTKTIRRAIKEKKDLKYKIVNNKYRIDLRSLILFMHTTKRLENKFYQNGLGQYVAKWRK